MNHVLTCLSYKHTTLVLEGLHVNGGARRTLHGNASVPSLTTSVFWQRLLSQSRSDCLQLLPHRSWRGELRRILTSFYCQTSTRRHARAHARAEYPPAKSTIVVRQEEPQEPSNQMCPPALMADWRRKTPWRIRHLHSPWAPSGDKQIDILQSLTNPTPPTPNTHAHTHTLTHKYTHENKYCIFGFAPHYKAKQQSEGWKDISAVAITGN